MSAPVQACRGATRAIVAAAVMAAAAVAPPVAAAEPTQYDHTVTSKDGTPIVMTVFKPVGASAARPVPVIENSHGWGGSRTTDINAFKAELDRGYAVVSIDQRGH